MGLLAGNDCKLSAIDCSPTPDRIGAGQNVFKPTRETEDSDVSTPAKGSKACPT